MPLMRCKKDGKAGWKFGASGTCYTGKDGRARAGRQGRAIKVRQAAAAKGDIAVEDIREAGLLVPEQLLPGRRRRKKRKDALGILFANDFANLAEKEEVEQEEALDILRQCARTLIAVRTPDGGQESGERVDALQIKKADDELQIVWGEVYIPDLPDSQGDFMTADEIRKAAYRFLALGRVDQVDRMHDQEPCGAVVVESFIARDGDHDFIPGAWVVGIHVPDREIWTAIKSGDFNGFSMQGRALRTQKEIELEIPEEVIGKTDLESGHDHDFVVKFGEDGLFLGGEAAAAASASGEIHLHRIKRGTVTEPGGADQHSHRYSFSEAILEVGLGTAAEPAVGG